MRLVLKIFFFLLMPAYSTAQQDSYVENWNDKQIDSLQNEWHHTSNDTSRMRISRSLGWHYQEINRDSSLFFHEQELHLARKLSLPLWEADALDQAGWVLSQLKNYPRSLQYFLDAIRIAKNPDCEKNIWHIGVFTNDNKTSSARLTVLGFINNDISQLYKETGNDAKQLSILLTGLKIGKTINNYAMLSTISVNLAEIYLKINKQDSASFFARQAINYMDKTTYKTYKGFAYTILGNVYLKKNNYDSAKQYFNTSVFENQQQNNITGLPFSYLCLAKLFEASGKNDSSIYYTRKALRDYQNIGLYSGVNDCYASLYSLYKSIGNSDSAFYYLQRHKISGDSLNSIEKAKLNEYQNVGFNEQIKQQELEKSRIEKENTLRTYILVAGILVFMLIAFLLYKNSRTSKKANEVLEQKNVQIEEQKEHVEQTLTELKSTQAQLIQSEKMASLGELTAGIAHEIQNPLNFVNNFSEVSNELIGEMNEELSKGDVDEAKLIAKDVQQNLEKILHHGKRADAIVKGMLQHSRSSSGVKEPTAINALCDEYLRLAYHGLRAKDKSFNCTLKTDYDQSIGNINIIPQDIGRVILNLITNAFYAVHAKSLTEAGAVNEKEKFLPKGHQLSAISYQPTVSVSTKKIENKVEVKVADNGNGIPQSILDKIFQPFFTTKPTGEGTGLGLSLAYDIVKAHGGELKVRTRADEGNSSHFWDDDARPPARTDDSGGDDAVGQETEFIITLPSK